MTYNTTTGRIFNSVEKAFDRAEALADNVFADFWTLLDHPEFPFVSLESTTNGQRNFPPYNIIELDNGQTRLDIAVAGYSKDRLNVELKGNILIVRALPAVESGECPLHGKVRKQGIANAAFVRTFELQPFVEVDQVAVLDGILSVLVSSKKKAEEPVKKFEIK